MIRMKEQTNVLPSEDIVQMIGNKRVLQGWKMESDLISF